MIRSRSPMVFADTAATSCWPPVSRLVTPVRTSGATSVELSLFCRVALLLSNVFAADWVSPASRVGQQHSLQGADVALDHRNHLDAIGRDLQIPRRIHPPVPDAGAREGERERQRNGHDRKDFAPGPASCPATTATAASAARLTAVESDSSGLPGHRCPC